MIRYEHSSRTLAAILLCFVLTGCSESSERDDRLAISVVATNPIRSLGALGSSNISASHGDDATLYQFQLIVWNYGRPIGAEDFDGPLRIVIDGAARIFDPESIPSRYGFVVDSEIEVVGDEVWIAPFSIDSSAHTVIQFKVAGPECCEEKPSVIGVIAKIDRVQKIELSYPSS